MRVLVTGGRSYANLERHHEVMNSLWHRGVDTILVGDAAGADSLTRLWAQANARHVVLKVFEADWNRLGAAAGPKRNQRMVDAKPDLCVAFPGGRGTADCVAKARRAGIPVETVEP